MVPMRWVTLSHRCSSLRRVSARHRANFPVSWPRYSSACLFSSSALRNSSAKSACSSLSMLSLVSLMFALHIFLMVSTEIFSFLLGGACWVSAPFFVDKTLRRRFKDGAEAVSLFGEGALLAVDSLMLESSEEILIWSSTPVGCW
ncbi:hypothetical protein F5883DRAFT_565424 [Diaporthe sp. PMI_573]|nr:hypothetical protein F5883DRAFT_565424 [Diaporthaceae sp. PMI_573]